MKPQIKRLRKQQGITQKYVAGKVGVTQQTLNEWEKGNVFPKMDAAYKLAAVLGVTVTDLYKED